MSTNQTRQELTTQGQTSTYETPRLTVIGDASDVILGVAGNGDDYYGYTFPEFEFESDDETA